MKEPQTEIGVVIGRFQLHKLHSEHEKLIQHVQNNHEKIIIFLGVSSAIGTQRHPLDFITRKVMIQQSFPEVVILPLSDNKSDEVWSNRLDEKIREIFPMSRVTLCLE
jgi:bifunctional NMN adenylyltransferase/nudix hydrolase